MATHGNSNSISGLDLGDFEAGSAIDVDKASIRCKAYRGFFVPAPIDIDGDQSLRVPINEMPLAFLSRNYEPHKNVIKGLKRAYRGRLLRFSVGLSGRISKRFMLKA